MSSNSKGGLSVFIQSMFVCLFFKLYNQRTVHFEAKNSSSCPAGYHF